MRHPNGSESVLSRAPFSSLLAVRHCPCSDGRRRYVRVTGKADTFFYVPAAVKVRGKAVSGFLTMAPDYLPSVQAGYVFHRVTYGKNAALLPEFTNATLASFTADIRVQEAMPILVDASGQPIPEEQDRTDLNDRWSVVVGNVGQVYEGDNEQKARATYAEYVSQSSNGIGRAAGEEVTLWKSGDVVKTHEGPSENDVDAMIRRAHGFPTA